MVDHRHPGGVQVVGRSGSASPGDAVGLLDERDADPFRARDACHRYQIWGSHSSSGSMTEDKRGARLVGGIQMDVRPTVRGVHFEDRHAGDAGRLDPFVSASVAAPAFASAPLLRATCVRFEICTAKAYERPAPSMTISLDWGMRLARQGAISRSFVASVCDLRSCNERFLRDTINARTAARGVCGAPWR
jgi:hypothetical protein